MEEVERPENDEASTKFIITLDINQIENLYTIEEGFYLNKICSGFDENWQNICFGEEMMSHFVNFCHRRFMLPPRFLQIVEKCCKYTQSRLKDYLVMTLPLFQRKGYQLHLLFRATRWHFKVVSV